MAGHETGLRHRVAVYFALADWLHLSGSASSSFSFVSNFELVVHQRAASNDYGLLRVPLMGNYSAVTLTPLYL